MKRSTLRRMSERRVEETVLYQVRRKKFLNDHPYCQVFLAENGIDEATAIKGGGTVQLANGTVVAVPLSTQIHHKNKRRGDDLLIQQHWMAVSRASHELIESNKAWSRARGYLLPF